MLAVIVHFLCSQEAAATQGSNDAKQVCDNLLMCIMLCIPVTDQKSTISFSLWSSRLY